MFNLDGSETSWLIYADWLEDNDKDNSLVKFGLKELITNQWHFSSKHNHYNILFNSYVGTVTLFGGVGGDNSSSVGTSYNNKVGNSGLVYCGVGV